MRTKHDKEARKLGHRTVNGVCVENHAELPQHTPTPWKLLDCTYEDNSQLKIISGKEPMYVMVGGKNRKADAEHIVRAVNEYESLRRKADSHEEVLNLIKEASEDLLSLSAKEAEPLGVRAALNRLFKAIAKAESR